MSGRILVIDDSPELVGFFSSVLSPIGYEVIPAFDGEEGLLRFRDELPDLVFLDLVLPRRQGSEVVAEMKATDHGLITPVVLMSGEAKGASRVEMMRAFGVVDFVPKPIPVAKITHLAEWILGGRSDEEVVPAADAELDRFDLGAGAEGVMPIGDAGLLLALRLAGEEALTGTLVAARGRHRRALVFERGRIVAARSNAPADRVDRIVVAMRKATPGQMSALREQLFAPGAHPLSVLESVGILDAAARETVLRYQAMTVALALFRWSEGTLRLVEGETIAADRLVEPIPTARLLLLGLRKSREARVRAAEPILREESVVLRTRSEEMLSLGAVALRRRERELFELVDGRRTLADLRVLGRLAQVPVDDTLAVIAGAGLVEPEPAASRASAEIHSPFVPRATGEYLAGDLRQRPLVEVVGQLHRARATGILSVEGSARRQFAFEDGEIVFARSSDPGDRLGQVLLNEGRIDVDVLDRVLAIQREQRPDRRLGALLVEQGTLSIAALEQAVRFQVMKILEATFGWTEGNVVFDPSEKGLGASIRLGLGHLDLIRMGVNRIDLPYLRRRWLATPDEFFLSATTLSPSRHALTAHELAILERSAELASIEELVSTDSRDAAVLRVVELLVALGLAQVQQRQRSRETPGRGVVPASKEIATQPVLAVASGATAAKLEPEPAGATLALEDDLPVLVLEPDPSPPASENGQGLDRMLAFLREEMGSRRDAAEREARVLAEEVGRLKERVRGLEEENRLLRERRWSPSSDAADRSTGSGQPSADAAQVARAESEQELTVPVRPVARSVPARSRRKKSQPPAVPEPEPTPVG